ncbi:MAG TPA: ABC-2 family transporter protein [Thermomicrobiales bacterium]|nr:ABC-2 family transporter protein [Thermomicrobiales bacterium]
MGGTEYRQPLDPTPLHAIRRHGRLWRRFLIQGIVRETHYRASFLATIAVGVIQLVLSLVPVLLLYSFTDTVNGWNQGEVIALSGMYQASFAVLAMLVQPNMNRISGYVRQGELDLILVRPVSSQLYVTLRWVDPAEVFNVLIGLAVVVVGLGRAGHMPSAGAVVQSLLLVACGMVLLTCAWSALVYLAFWFTTVAPIPMLARDVMDAGRFPLAFYPAAVRLFLGFIFPVGFATTFPVEALAGRSSWTLVAAGAVISAGALLLLRAYWRFAVRFYSSASS